MTDERAEVFPEPSRVELDPEFVEQFAEPMVSPEPGEPTHGLPVGLGVVVLPLVVRPDRGTGGERASEYVSARERLNRAPLKDSGEEARIKRRETQAVYKEASRRRSRPRTPRATDNSA